MTLTTDSVGKPQLTVAKANLGPQNIYIGLDPVLDYKERLLGYKTDDKACWKPLNPPENGDTGRGGPQPGNSKKPSQTKRLFED